jgi:hypothetical protein
MNLKCYKSVILAPSFQPQFSLNCITPKNIAASGNLRRLLQYVGIVQLLN